MSTNIHLGQTIKRVRRRIILKYTPETKSVISVIPDTVIPPKPKLKVPKPKLDNSTHVKKLINKYNNTIF